MYVLQEGFYTNHSIPTIRVDPDGRCAAMLVYGTHLVILPFRRDVAVEDSDVMGTRWVTINHSIPTIRVDPDGRCAAMLVYGTHLVILPFRRDVAVEDSDVMGTRWVIFPPYEWTRMVGVPPCLCTVHIWLYCHSDEMWQWKKVTSLGQGELLWTFFCSGRFNFALSLLGTDS